MKIAVIGSGITGLSTAYAIQKKFGHAQIDIYEKESEIAGLAGTFQLGNQRIEKYYHFIYTHDQYYLNMLDELGLKQLVRWCKSTTGYYSEGKIYPFTTASDILRFKPLSFINRVRLGLSTILISRYKDLDQLETQTTEEFLVKFVGKQGWEKVWKPMLKVKFGDNYNKIPAVWIWERIASRFKSRKGGGSEEVFGYIEGSFHVVNQKILDILQKNGANLYLDSPVDEIIIEQGECQGIIVHGEKKEYDYVVCTTALPVFVDLCKNAPSSYIDPLKKVKYDAVINVFLILKEKLSDYYWLNISDDKIPFGGLIEHTNFMPSDAYGGKALVYLSKYLNPENKFFTLPDEEIKTLYVKHLKKIYPGFNENLIESFSVFRNRYGQPIWPMKYSSFKPDFKTPVKGLFLSDTAQIYPYDRAMNYCVQLAQEAAESFSKEVNG